MFDEISTSFYNPKENILKRLNPINVTFLLFLLSVCIFLNTSLWVQVFLFLGSIFLSYLCGRKGKSFIKTVKHTFFLPVSFCFLCFFHRFSLLSFTLYFLKMYSLLFFSQLYLQNMKRSSIEKTMCYFLKPLTLLKIEPSYIAKSLSLSIQFLSILYKEAMQLWRSLQSRGIDLKKCSILKKIKWLKTFLVPLLLKTERSAELLADSFIVKGFEQNKEEELEPFGFIDSLVLVIFLYFFLYIILMR